MTDRTAPGASQRAISHHYDVGNDFYALWLDPTRSYSCALWDGTDDLETAQLAKLDFHADQARAKNAGRVLDIGCGWGAMLHRLVSTHGVREAVGLTLATAQAAYVLEQGWQGVSVDVASWADHTPTSPYDAIISIGAFEHFARHDQNEADKIAGYRLFFQRCHDWLAPGGWLSLQTMSYSNSRREDFSAFFASEIFPESDLPRLAEIAQASDLRFELVRLRDDREQYARTTAEWRRRLRARRAEAIELVGEATYDRYDKYLAFVTIGFHTGTMGLLRLAFRRIDRPRG